MIDFHSKPIFNILFLCVFLYALVFFYLEEFVEPLLGFAIILVLYVYSRESKRLFLTTPFVLVYLSTVLALLSWFLVFKQHPDVAGSSPRIENLINKFVFIPIALILLGSESKTLFFWAALGISALLTPWFSGEGIVEISRAFSGIRTGFGLHPITMGMVHAVAFMAIVIFFRRLVFGRNKALKSVAFILLAVAFLFGVVASQTRAIYLAFFVVLVSFFLGLVFLRFKGRVEFSKYFAFLFYSLFIFFAISYTLYEYGFLDSFIKKLFREMDVIEPLLRGDLSAVPRNSAGLRIHFWVDAWQMGVERFWIGWGEAANHYLHANSGNYFGDRLFITVHNDWLELFLAYGIFGPLILAYLIFWLSRKVYCLWIGGILATDFFIFYIVFLLFFLVNGFFMSVLYFKETILLWNVILSGYLGFVFKKTFGFG